MKLLADFFVKMEWPRIILNGKQLANLAEFCRELSQGLLLAGVGASFVNSNLGRVLQFKLIAISGLFLYLSVYLLKFTKGDL